MKVLVVGSGGRESAIVWKLNQSGQVSKIYAAPGNVGMQNIAELVDISSTDIFRLLEFAEKEKIDLTVVGPEAALALGIVDIFEEKGLRIFGPTKAAAIIEYSKSFSKDFMKRNNIPSAWYELFESKDLAYDYIAKQTFPLVIKADGLAVGKGVYICENLTEAETALNDLMDLSKFGESGKKVVIEEYLEGTEVSVLSFVDGRTVVPMISAKDHKRIYDGDKGPNTGGMGSVSPNPAYDYETSLVCMEEIFKPTVAALAKEGIPFKGVIFFGLMLTKSGPKLIEYNARFGDPETQAVLPMLDFDIFEIFLACCDGSLDKLNIKWKEGAAVCVVLASKGYPDDFEKGFVINGFSSLDEKEDALVFMAGARSEGDKIVTAGGRVLGVTAIADTVKEAVNKAYTYSANIEFENKYCRNDIGRN